LGCGQKKKPVIQARSEPRTMITRWKWDPRSLVGIPKGIILEQTGPKVEASFVHLKDVPGFEIDAHISQGKYFAERKEIVFPPAKLTPSEIDQFIAMDGGRVIVPFTPKAPSLKAKWTGQGAPKLDMEFVRFLD
jgi:hypothetical protein